MSLVLQENIVSPNLPKVKIASSHKLNFSKPMRIDPYENNRDKNKANWSTQFVNSFTKPENERRKTEMIDIKKIIEMNKMKHQARDILNECDIIRSNCKSKFEFFYKPYNCMSVTNYLVPMKFNEGNDCSHALSPSNSNSQKWK